MTAYIGPTSAFSALGAEGQRIYGRSPAASSYCLHSGYLGDLPHWQVRARAGVTVDREPGRPSSIRSCNWLLALSWTPGNRPSRRTWGDGSLPVGAARAGAPAPPEGHPRSQPRGCDASPLPAASLPPGDHQV